MHTTRFRRVSELGGSPKRVVSLRLPLVLSWPKNSSTHRKECGDFCMMQKDGPWLVRAGLALAKQRRNQLRDTWSVTFLWIPPILPLGGCLLGAVALLRPYLVFATMEVGFSGFSKRTVVYQNLPSASMVAELVVSCVC